MTSNILIIFIWTTSKSYIVFRCWHGAGIEARGFIFGPPIALAIGAKFVPMRKPKKLPGIFFDTHVIHLNYFYIHYILAKEESSIIVYNNAILAQKYICFFSP